jgi:hypothetical protein
MLVFATVSLLAFVLWFKVSDATHWQGMITIGCGITAYPLSALLWLRLSTPIAGASVAVMLLSLLRIGAPESWSGATILVVGLTLVLMMPVLYATYAARN